MRKGGIVHLIDSAASHHYEPEMKNFINLQETWPLAIEAAMGQIVYARKKGTVRFAYEQDGKSKVMDLPNVYYAPDLPSPLISVACL